MLLDKRNASRITSSRSLKCATFLLAGWRLSHPKELPGDLPVPLECHALTMNTIVLQLSVAEICMLQCSAKFRNLIINAHFVADNSTHALASSATSWPNFNLEEEVVVIRSGWTPKKEKKKMTDKPDWRIGVLFGTWNLGCLRGKRREVCEELRKRIIDVCCLQKVRWRAHDARMHGMTGGRNKLRWS